MPNRGSREKVQPVESAPTSRPSTNTGEPLMPCATPVLATRSEVARATIRSPSARPPASTPTISASKVSTESPRNTVRTWAFWPGRRVWRSSSVGVSGAPRVGAAGASGASHASAAASSNDGSAERTMWADYNSGGWPDTGAAVVRATPLVSARATPPST